MQINFITPAYFYPSIYFPYRAQEESNRNEDSSEQNQTFEDNAGNSDKCQLSRDDTSSGNKQDTGDNPTNPLYPPDPEDR